MSHPMYESYTWRLALNIRRRHNYKFNFQFKY